MTTNADAATARARKEVERLEAEVAAAERVLQNGEDAQRDRRRRLAHLKTLLEHAEAHPLLAEPTLPLAES
jgi:hypothetical protein